MYTPAVGDSISIHFGATFHDVPYGVDNHFYTWNYDFPLDIFQITVNDGINGYVIDVPPWTSDDNGYGSSFRDTFYIKYDSFIDIGSVGQFGYIAFDHDSQNGFFEMFNPDFRWNAILTTSCIITEPSPAPVPEPGTLLLLGTGLLGVTGVLKRRK